MNEADPPERRWPGIDEAALRAAMAKAGELPTYPARAGELALACACALGHPAALRELEALLSREVPRAVRPLNAALVDEVAQQLRERLLLGTGGDGRARIADYRGQGPLAAWLRAIAIRTALNLQRSAGQLPPGDAEEVERLEDVANPERDLFRQQYAAVFKAAFAHALGQLDPRDRTLLKLHTLDGLPLSKIGEMYGRDTSTASRWLEQIRRRLREGTRAALTTRLAVATAELESVLRAADFEVSVSLGSLLAEKAT